MTRRACAWRQLSSTLQSLVATHAGTPCLSSCAAMFVATSASLLQYDT
jgi:hypothetical protein